MVPLRSVTRSLTTQRRCLLPLKVPLLKKRSVSDCYICWKRPLTTASTSSCHGRILSVHNSLTGLVEPLPGQQNEEIGDTGIACYTCGPTVYSQAHLGHARTYVWLDILRRVWEHNSNTPLHFVVNITDVDDKILEAAVEANEDPLKRARRYETAFWKEWDALNCLRPNQVTRVSEYVESHIVPYIEQLVKKGMAYQINDGDDEALHGVFFDVQAYEDQCEKMNSRYGKLAPSSKATSLFETSSPSEFKKSSPKRDPRDFALWKRRKSGEGLFWSSPWGEGRPGWHIECSAMIEAVRLQLEGKYKFLVHAGGVDLQFPHHTNEIAQSEAYHVDHFAASGRDEEWIPHWIHTGHLHIDGHKMSKSLKNFISIEEFLKGNDDDNSIFDSPSDDFRLWCLGLSGSYRSPATYSESSLQNAAMIRLKLVRFLLDAEEWQDRTKDSGRKAWTAKEDMALMELVKKKSQATNSLCKDLDGSMFVNAMVEIAEAGLFSIKNSDTPSELVLTTSQTLRSMLALVGFSDRTCRIGVSCQSSSTTSHVMGGEAAAVDALVAFRSQIRAIALQGSSTEASAKEKLRLLLEECDNLRNNSLPALGVELLDNKARDDQKSRWRYCLPRVESSEKQACEGRSLPPSLQELQSIPVQEFFRVGQYEGQFSEYDERGIPTKNADGSDISKRMLQKFEKKRAKHIKRLEQKTDI